MAWKLKIFFDDGSTEEDGDFDSKEEAEDRYNEWLESYSAGRNTLLLSDPFDEDIPEGNIEHGEVWEETTSKGKKKNWFFLD